MRFAWKGIDGRLSWSDDERLALPAPLSENVGADQAVRLGDPRRLAGGGRRAAPAIVIAQLGLPRFLKCFSVLVACFRTSRSMRMVGMSVRPLTSRPISV